MHFYYMCTAFFFTYVLLDVTWRIWKRKFSFLPSYSNIPWIGSLPFLKTDTHEIYKNTMKNMITYNYMLVLWFAHMPVIVMGTVEYVEAMLKSRKNLSKSIFYHFVREWLGEGLLLSTSSKWKHRRAALTAAFHFSILNEFVGIFEYHAKNLVDKLQSFSSRKEVVEVELLCSLAMLDVICETSMGARLDALNSSDSEYVKAVHEIKLLIIKKVNSPIRGSKLVYPFTKDGKNYYKCLKILHEFTRNVIKDNIVLRQGQKENAIPHTRTSDGSRYSRKKVFIDVLLDLYDNGEIDLEGIREEVDTFMFEGHDTTSAALSWTLYEIGRHPDIQARLHEEIDDVRCREVSLQDKVRSLKFLECVVKESLRMHPPVPRFSRTLEHEIVIDNHVVPVGTTLSVESHWVHMNPKYWDEPSVFNPGRFETDDFAKRNPYSYIPFSAGPRNCIGQKFAMLEEKVFLYHILSCFALKSTQAPDEIKTSLNIITTTLNGIHIEFSMREN